MPTHTHRHGDEASSSRLTARTVGLGGMSLTEREEHNDRIRQSHERCAALGLTRIDAPDYSQVLRSDLSVARERNQRLLAHAAPVMEMLFEQIVATESMIVLTDAQGTILHAIGDDDFLARASKVALQPGVNWSETAKGTNAIGTALFCEAPTLVHANEHFMHANEFLTCSAAPILDPRGNMLGVLDVTGDHRSYHRHTMGLVRMSARMIENHWLTEDYRHSLRLHFHSRPEFIGTLLEGIVVLNADGRCIGANRSALDQLDLSASALRMHDVRSLFGMTLGALVDHFRSPMATPMQLHVAGGRGFYAQARFVGGPGLPMPPATGAADGSAASGAGAIRDLTPNRTTPSASLDATQVEPVVGLNVLRTGDAQVDSTIGKLQRVVDRDVTVLVVGDTGTGKEVLARAFHHDSRRARQPFVAVNCAVATAGALEAELFGVVDGAFSGARQRGSHGRIVQANGGTLYLDEVGAIPPDLQARLAQVLEERRVMPAGGKDPIPVDIALVAATSRNLRAMIDRGEFREDLYYRLNGLVVRLPALRERTDMAALVRQILDTHAPRRGLRLAPEVEAMLSRHRWPGNLRELSNLLRTAALMAGSDNLISEAHLSDDFIESVRQPDGRPDSLGLAAADAARTLAETEIDLIRRAVDEADGNISVASRRLGISRNTIYRKLRWNRDGAEG